jgi:prevent-host-death family protein
MRSVNIQVAKTHLSRLVEEAQAGEDIVFAKAGRPCVRLVPVRSDERPRELGRLRGTIRIADDFDAPSPELEAMFGLAAATTQSGSTPTKPRRQPKSRQPKRPQRRTSKTRR